MIASVKPIALLAALVILVAAGCGGSAREETGLVVEVERELSISAFTLATDEGPVQIWIDPMVEYGFSLEHLEVHRKDRLPLRVTVEERDGRLYALAMFDA